MLAQLQARQGQYEEASENAATALQLDSESRVVLDGAIDVAQLTGDFALAVRRIRQGLARQPSDAKLRMMLASALGQMEQYDEALALWDGLIADSPEDRAALEGRMHMLLIAGRLEEAALATAHLRALDPTNPVYAYYEERAQGQTPAHQPTELNRQLFDNAAHFSTPSWSRA